MPRQRLPLACAHCSIDADLEGAEILAVFAEDTADGAAIGWDGPLAAEQFVAAAASQCMHLAAYRRA
jgi:hypothetical protein